MPDPLTSQAGSWEDVDVLIVGAGPAGLALARQLLRRGVACRVIDRVAPGSSWRDMPPALRLVSPWWTNTLRWRDVLRHPPFSLVGAIDYARYVDDFVKAEGLRVTTGCEARSVTTNPLTGRLDVATDNGGFRARAVAVCTGYFSQPAPPVPAPTSDQSVPVMHAARYPGPEAVRQIASSRPVVIVGRRVSAGQLMVDLVQAGLDVTLSTRAPLEFRRDGWLGRCKDTIYYFYEELLLRIKPRIQAGSFPVMDGGPARHLYEAGRVTVRGRILRIEQGHVVFEDGSRIEAGLVINATGYSPALPELRAPVAHSAQDGLPQCRDWESVSQPNLFFLGLDNRRNYRSRTLRGIRTDARLLARMIAGRLADVPGINPARRSR